MKQLASLVIIYFEVLVQFTADVFLEKLDLKTLTIPIYLGYSIESQLWTYSMCAVKLLLSLHKLQTLDELEETRNKLDSSLEHSRRDSANAVEATRKAKKRQWCVPLLVTEQQKKKKREKEELKQQSAEGSSKPLVHSSSR